MKIPPPVAYPTGALTVEVVLTSILTVVWLIVQVVWALHLAQSGASLPAAWWIALAAGSLLLAWNVWRLLAACPGELHWTHVQSPSVPGLSAGRWTLMTPAWRRGLVVAEVQCTLDLDRLMLLYVRSASGLGMWLWCHARERPSQWLALRRAVYAFRHKELQGRPGARRS